MIRFNDDDHTKIIILMIIFIAKVGVPDVTCLIYEAKDGGPVEDCTKPDINLCR